MVDMTSTATKSAEQRAADKAIATAQEIIELVEKSGVSLSPSAVRYAVAKALSSALSQSSIRRLHDEVRHLNRKVRS